MNPARLPLIQIRVGIKHQIHTIWRMNDSTTYSVISTGQIQDSFGLADVQASFAKLFKTTPEKANAYIGVKRVLKKDLDLKKAQVLKARLEKIGMVIALKEHKPPVATGEPLSLVVEESESSKFDNPITCPKCNLEQEMAEQCNGCGVYINKVLNIAPEALNTNDSSEDNEKQSDAPVITTVQEKVDTLSFVGLGAAAIAAVIGALVWKFIAVIFGYEFGIIAWGIGGAVGFTAAMFGSKGYNTGVICGVLTLLAIFGGKYMAMSSIQETWADEIKATTQLQSDEFKEVYVKEIKAAQIYAEEVAGGDDASLKKFMSDYGYSDYYGVDELASEDLEDFKEYYAPVLEKIALENPTFDEWVSISFGGNIEDYSTLELMKLDFGILSIIFLFLGVATAFRLGKGE